MSEETAHDEVGRNIGGDEPDFEGHGRRGGDQAVERTHEGDEPDFEGHGHRGGDKFVEKVSEH